MKLYLISDYPRIDGETGDFAEKEFCQDFSKYDSEISLFSARNQMVSFQPVAEREDGECLSDFDISFTPWPDRQAVFLPITRSLSSGSTGWRGLSCRICSSL